MIEFDDVSKAYAGGSHAVDHLSLRIPDRSVTVLVGPSGCGKTTSLRMINRMIDPTSGRVTIDGTDVATREPAALRRGIGYVIQHGGLFPHRTVVDNVATVPVLAGTPRREARAAALDLLERVGLDRALGARYPAQLSGGQQQRVGVARALAADPPILLMDEPFSAVDPVVREDLQAELLRLQGELGKTIVLVTHDIDEAVRLGDQIAVLAVGGRLAQFGTPEEVLSSPADEFVERFVGRDRGFRSLSFVPARDLSVAPPTEPVDGHRLVLDADGRPEGWQAGGGPVLPLGGTYAADGSVRTVSDLLVLSPVGAAVRVDDAGRADGVVTSAAVDELLRRRARAGR